MVTVPGVGSNNSSSNSSTSTTRGNDLRDVDLSQFMNLMIAELQNQDPLNPMDNSQLLQQITQIREIGATDKLRESLTTMSDAFNLSTASTMIGREVVAMTDDLKEVTGVVDRVSVDRDEKDPNIRITRLHIGEAKVQLRNIRQVLE